MSRPLGLEKYPQLKWGDGRVVRPDLPLPDVTSSSDSIHLVEAFHGHDLGSENDCDFSEQCIHYYSSLGRP